MKNKKNNKKSRLRKEAAKLWILACLKKWGDKCVVCSAPGNNMHHFIPKSRNEKMAFDPENGVPLCQKHHYIVHFSKSPSEIHRIINTIREKRGKKWCQYIDLEEKNLGASYKNIEWYKEQIAYLKELL